MNLYAVVRPRSIFSILLTVSLFCLFQLSIVAQSGTVGTLTGVVKDPNGANLPGVAVVVKNLATGATRTAITGEDGHWTIPALPVAAYEVSYECTGFKRLVRDRVEVEASVPRTLGRQTRGRRDRCSNQHHRRRCSHHSRDISSCTTTLGGTTRRSANLNAKFYATLIYRGWS